ncbi:putative thioredoxin (plasmid) [Campylobacter iguaniorum]|uniref:Putative thioredoxin n=1 Tax=Campylobacter iguaniorum TaxID=1244531 RepID=A0A076FBJ0_9BACT|nr:DUF255 domain-containing protein [Campylobacter iguaniorum]AII15595.1 putative thioredoxin [Campylobacter iguaniorum]
MKKIAKILLGVALLLQASYGQVFNSIYDAIPEAQKQGKLTIFFILSNTCPHCHELMADVNSNQKLASYLNENFIVTITDLAKGGKVPMDLPFNGTTPTTMILTPSGQVVGDPIEGKIPSDMLLEYLDKIETLKKSYVGG